MKKSALVNLVCTAKSVQA